MVSMLSRILVPVDGLAASEQAVLTAIALAVASNASVATASVIDSCASTGVASNMAYGQDECLAAVPAQADSAIQAAAQPCAAKAVTAVTAVSSMVEDQAVYTSIVEAAGVAGADVVVTGCDGCKSLEKRILGSVAAQVLSPSHLPVLVVRPAAA